MAGFGFVLIALILWPLDLKAQDLELDRGRAQDMLKCVAEDVEKNFYDPNLKDVDWKSLVGQARERIDGAKSRSDMFRAIFVLLGNLHDSHTLFVPPGRAGQILFGFDAMPFGNNEIRIYKLSKDGVAAKAGLKVGDRILGINNFNADRKTWDIMMLDFRVLRRVQAMDVTFVRGTESPRTINLQGEVIEGQLLRDYTVNGWNQLAREAAQRASEEEKVRAENYDNGTGYLRVPSFMVEESRLDSQVKKIRDSRALTIDLRLNPGGSTDVLTHLAGYFEAEPLILAEVNRRKKTEELKTNPERPTLGMPLFILVDSETASAGEMFARRFQQNGRAKVIGDTTSGRVNEARFFPHRSGIDVIVPYAVEVAVGRVVLPGGEELEGKGVIPDQPCVPSADDQVAGRDPCLDLAKTLSGKSFVPAAKP
jgi:C-terminal processing protease CtpA/Prc